MAAASSSESASAVSSNSVPLRTSRIVELQDDGTEPAEMDGATQDGFFTPIPTLFTTLPELRDVLITDTSEMQDATVEECLRLLASPEGDLNVHGISSLARSKHVKFLKRQLSGPFPEGFVALDASRPWMLYWALTGLYLLGEDLSEYRRQVIDTLAPMQNEDGGFGGGHGHFSHIATSYAAVLSLIMVGGNEAYDLIDRKGM
jgi:protein farnesyltransferase subunit beta